MSLNPNEYDLSPRRHSIRVAGPDNSGPYQRVLVEEQAQVKQERRYVPPLDDLELPAFSQSPRRLSPIENNPEFRIIQEQLAPLRAQRDAMRNRIAAIWEELRAQDPITLKLHLADGTVRQKYTQDRDRLQTELTEIIEPAYAEQHDQHVKPLLEERLKMSAMLPCYTWQGVADDLKLPPAINNAEHVQYGICEVEPERIIATAGPSNFDWSGQNSEKVEGKSAKLIVDHALNMLRGDFRWLDSAATIRLYVALTPDNNYVYLLEDGSHRVAAAKLIGMKEIPVRVESYNYTADDLRARLTDTEHKARQVN